MEYWKHRCEGWIRLLSMVTLKMNNKSKIKRALWLDKISCISTILCPNKTGPAFLELLLATECILMQIRWWFPKFLFEKHIKTEAEGTQIYSHMWHSWNDSLWVQGYLKFTASLKHLITFLTYLINKNTLYSKCPVTRYPRIWNSHATGNNYKENETFRTSHVEAG